MVDVFKILNGIYEPEVAPQLQLAEDDKNLRGQKWKLKKQRMEKLDLRNYFFSQRVVEPWNSLPESVDAKTKSTT